jgi:LETM1 and EF-hand domain-containing protein 1, mitochondrial
MLGSLNRNRLTTNDVVKVLAVNYVNGMMGWQSAQARRNVSTETHSPDPKPFPLPTQTQKESPSNTRAPPPPMPPQPPRTEPPKKSESEQSVSAESANPTPSTATLESTPDSTTLTDKAATAIDKKDKPEKKLTLWQKVKKEANHYWDGTKLLGKEIRISFRLALKMAAGYELSRRESRQLKRTTQDLIRLVPFSVFVIVPFAELLLPVALKLFPNMLPSTYEGEKAKEAKRVALSKTRKDVSNFLRTTIQESGLYISKATKQSEEFAEFFKKVPFTSWD